MDIDTSKNGQISRDSITGKQKTSIERVGASIGTFANPRKNVHKIGLREGMSVADFGSGSGAYTIALAELLGPSGEVYAVDIQKDLLVRVKNNANSAGHDTVHTVWGDIDLAGSVGIRDELLDGVIISNTLFQTEYKNVALKQAWRVLKYGGILAIIDWAESYKGMGPQQKDIVSQSTATIIATDNGFSFKHEFDAGEHHYGIVFTKGSLYNTSVDDINSNATTDSSGETLPNDFVAKTISQELL